MCDFPASCASSQRVFSGRPLRDLTAEGSVSEEPRPDRGGGGLLPKCVFHVSSATVVPVCESDDSCLLNNAILLELFKLLNFSFP